MRLLIQRVSQARVEVEGRVTGKIGYGLLIFAGFEESDTQSDLDYATKKVVNLRIFDDSDGIMNKSLMDTSGEILLVSQFTLHAQTRRGNRPSYIRAAKPEIAIPLYDSFIQSLSAALGRGIATGIFGAMMMVSLVNDGPVTIWIDTKEVTGDQ
ncbi:MAG: D-aminoacyl-tRNA deacylase [Bacteroidales bacterium]|nr:D-aminoacyl-tRNA deacylase [Bacteroidales bacterium]MDD3989281.1 D-aminoacyl-tRNA deacylase [Bacteroidales bacterium]MDD4638586.1 D-aminoacyl-tRNA deacylase [Bacteroidales bacterium]